MPAFIQKYHQTPQYWFAIFLVVPSLLIISFVFNETYQVGRIFKEPFMLVYLCLLLPVIEELAFRGFIQGYLSRHALMRKSIMKISCANFITSFVFSLIHLPNHTLSWSCAVFLPSLVFGYLRDAYQSTRPAMEMHIIYNFCYFLIFY
jgi:membrane protease YdiL (CAAX protease family)